MERTLRDGTIFLVPDKPLIAAHEETVTRELTAALAQREGARSVVLDLAQVREVDSRGIALIVELHRRCREQGLALVAVGLTDHVRRVFDLFQMESLFPIEPASAGEVKR